MEAVNAIRSRTVAAKKYGRQERPIGWLYAYNTCGAVRPMSKIISRSVGVSSRHPARKRGSEGERKILARKVRVMEGEVPGLSFMGDPLFDGDVSICGRH